MWLVASERKLSDGSIDRFYELVEAWLLFPPLLTARQRAAIHAAGEQSGLPHVLPLLELERAAEVAQAEEALSGCSPAAAAARGRALLNLRLTEAEGGLLGRTLLTLGSGSDPLPAHKFAPHDIVRLRPSKSPADAAAGPALAEGVVYRVADSQIIVAVDELPEDGGLDVPLRLEKLANEVTYQRLRAALQGLRGESGQAGVAAPLVDVLFGRRAPRFVPSPPPWKPLNPGLDDSQQASKRSSRLGHAAVAKALAAQDLALVHGPPGTVDNLVERLAAQKPGGKAVRVVRVGHPARLLPQVLANSLEAKVLQSDNSALAKDCRKEMKALSSRLLKLGRKDYAERRQVRACIRRTPAPPSAQLRQELRQLSKEERKRQERAVEEVLKGAQALEPACWAALLKGRRAVLAGDHLQLPPTVVSEEAARRGLARTLFERLQYRMNSDIMDWSSQEMYGGQLQGHGSVASHALGGLRGAGAAAGDVPVLLLVDTAGCDMEEQEEEEGASTWNEGEARVVMAHVRRLLDAGVPAREIGVITPYAAQARLAACVPTRLARALVARLRELRPEALAGQLEISTVDGFQARKPSLHCALVCDSETVGADPFLRRLVEYFEARGDYSSAGEFEAG
eukprot:scaffold10.g2446.t1